MPLFKNTPKASLAVDFRIVSLILLAVIIAITLLWKPWVQTSGRTIQVNGNATIKADPDEFVFNPSYQISNADKDAALKDLTSKTNEIVGKLKELGVPENKIQTNSNANDMIIYGPEQEKRDPTYYLNFTITVGSKEDAQKISNYLVTTPLLGSISPQPNFSTEKRKTLESQAREEAIKDARKQAEQSASNLGAKLGSVKSVEDGQSLGGGPMPLDAVSSFRAEGGTASTMAAAAPSIGVLPGQSEFSYNVRVTYFIR